MSKNRALYFHATQNFGGPYLKMVGGSIIDKDSDSTEKTVRFNASTVKVGRTNYCQLFFSLVLVLDLHLPPALTDITSSCLPTCLHPHPHPHPHVLKATNPLTALFAGLPSDQAAAL